MTLRNTGQSITAPRFGWDGNITTNGIESAFSLFKRGVIGSFHKISIKHLHRYLSEFETRFNGRKADDRFEPTLKRMLGVEPMPYADLVAGIGGTIGLKFPGSPFIVFPSGRGLHQLPEQRIECVLWYWRYIGQWFRHQRFF